ncbi:WD repeat-containing protein 92 [Terramyces sp. JEL0728]|nr:WD repeat-containing protein 92 [Terramyces sp. JEL0728]
MLDKPQIIIHSSKSLTYTAYDVHWIPSSPRFVILGQKANGTGTIQVCQLSSGSIADLHQTDKPHAFKCGTFGHSSLASRKLATGDFGGRLSIWDLERLDKPDISFSAHEQIINCIDGLGGKSINCGPPEIVTGSRDGAVKIWDARQPDNPVAVLAPAEGEPVIDPWTVSFGNSYNNQERMVAAGYENGDLKLFDLRQMKLVWETNLKNGVCSVEFDRKDIQMNKLVCTGLEAKSHVFDMRTFHPTKGYTSLSQKANNTNITGWLVKHLPQNRDLFIHYPPSRIKRDEQDKHDQGVVGKVELIQSNNVAEQPVGAFNWSPDKAGLCVFAAYDQTVKIGMVTRIGSI